MFSVDFYDVWEGSVEDVLHVRRRHLFDDVNIVRVAFSYYIDVLVERAIRYDSLLYFVSAPRKDEGDVVPLSAERG